jgi:hypothetical protein
MENEITEQIERWKIKAEALKISNKHAFIKDIHDTWYFCDILNWDDYILQVKHFKGEKINKLDDIFWSDITLLEKYKEVKEW